MSQEERNFNTRREDAAERAENQLLGSVTEITVQLNRLSRSLASADTDDVKRELEARIRDLTANLDQVSRQYREELDQEGQSAAEANRKVREAWAKGQLESIQEQRRDLIAQGQFTNRMRRDLDAQEQQLKSQMIDEASGYTQARLALDQANQTGGIRQLIYDNVLSENYKNNRAQADADSQESLGDVAKGIKELSNTVGNALSGLTKLIDSTVQTLTNTFGVINANLEGTGKDFTSIKSTIESTIGATGYLKEAEYLQQIANLTSAGLNLDVESRALLDVLSSKTLKTFSAMDSSLTRLVRLKQSDVTTSQFGLELQLKRVLNSVFQDTSYLNGMYDKITEAITDAGVMTGSDLTTFNSAVQTWLGAMYESGLSDNVVSAIANGINALGSGNINALASNQDMQRLFLLSMDTIGLDYADILQQGLSASDTNNLLSAIVSYLADIADQTSDNLVLQSAYSGLFGMSLSDMTAIKNLSAKSADISSTIISTSEANQLTQAAVTNIAAQNTLAAEYIDNALSNIKFMFGSSVAEDKTTYFSYKLGDLISSTATSISGVSSNAVIQTVTGGLALAGQLLQLASVAKPFIETAGELKLTDLLTQQNNLGALLTLSGTEVADISSSGLSISTDNTFKTLAATKLSSNASTIEATTAQWKTDAENEGALGELKKLTKALVYYEEDPALAVFLQGMSNETLRSFASIFADEEAMLATFTGENNVLEEALFDYAGDTTTNNTEDTSSNVTDTKTIAAQEVAVKNA